MKHLTVFVCTPSEITPFQVAKLERDGWDTELKGESECGIPGGMFIATNTLKRTLPKED